MIRGQKVMLDEDLAELYGVETKVLNQAVSRNSIRFPEDFMFKLSEEEFADLKSQIVTSRWGGRRKLPNVFTEHGLSVRDYAGDEGNDVIGLALNRSVPVYDPSQGPLDLAAELKSFNREIHVSFPVSVDYIFKTGNRTQLKVGLMHNIAIQPLAESELTVIMYQKEYKGKFSPRTSFWGANVAFDVNFSKRLKVLNSMELASKDLTNSYRKSIFIERHGSGVFLSANYDTRIKRDVNDGFGLKAGIGIGDHYWSAFTNDNKPPLKRALTIPLGINYILGKKKHGLEAGVGFTPQFALDQTREGFAGVKHKFPYHIGYRFQPKKEGLLARIAWAPVMDKLPGWSNFKYISFNTGISIGYSFK